MSNLMDHHHVSLSHFVLPDIQKPLTLLMLISFGVWYAATVTATADPSLSGTMVWMIPFPNVCSPTTTARLLSWSAPVSTSAALAVPRLTRTFHYQDHKQIQSEGNQECKVGVGR